MESGAATEQHTDRRPSNTAVLVPPSSAPPGGAAGQKARIARRGSISSTHSGSRGGSQRGNVVPRGGQGVVGAAGGAKHGKTAPGGRGGAAGDHGESPGADENEADEWESVATKNTVQRVGLDLLREQKKRRPEDISYEKPPIKFEPSYQLRPDSEHRFSSVRVRLALNDLIAKYIEQSPDKYTQRAARRISVGLSELVKEQIKGA